MRDIVGAIDTEATQHEILARLARQLQIETYLEVGVRDGCTLWVVQEASVGRLKLAALADDWGSAHGGTGAGDHDHIDRLLRAIMFYYHGGRALWLDGKSQETLPLLLQESPGLRFDLVHIDGDHDEEPAYQDFCNGWALCGGAMVAHDMGYTPTRKAMERFLSDHMVSDVPARWFSGGRGTTVVWRNRQ